MSPRVYLPLKLLFFVAASSKTPCTAFCASPFIDPGKATSLPQWTVLKTSSCIKATILLPIFQELTFLFVREPKHPSTALNSPFRRKGKGGGGAEKAELGVIPGQKGFYLPSPPISKSHIYPSWKEGKGELSKFNVLIIWLILG